MDKDKKYRGKYQRRLQSRLIAAALLVGLLMPGAARAAGYVYQQHLMNAGVLVNGTDFAPYVFYVLNNRPDVRPPDLTLVNPLAAPSAAPNTAAYWEVPLNSVSDSELAQYNVLYLRADGISFGPAINEKLRRFVDNGGQLIVEYGTYTTPATLGLFTGFGQASGSGTVGPPLIAGSTYLSHPVIAQPYLLTQQDLIGLGTPGDSITADTADPVHSGEYSNVFSPVLTDTTGPVVAAAQIGAGQVVASALNLGTGISVNNGATFAPSDLYKASATDLKVLVNTISWAETHPNENKTSHGNASNSGLASFSPAWQFPVTTTGATSLPSGAAVWGNFVFAVDAGGMLHAFDAYPSENLTGTANPSGAEQVTTGLSQYPATSYDEIWNKSGLTGASVPTVAAFKGVTYLFVETHTGSVVAFNAVNGASGPALAAPASGGSFTGNAPSPTYYDGRLYAGQADGTLHVYDLNESSSVSVPLDPTTTTAEAATGSPAVGTLANGNTNVIVAVVPTSYNIYSVLLGARNDSLKSYTPNNTLSGYSINRQGNYDLNNIFADVNAVPSLLAYDVNGNVQTGSPNNTAPNPQDPLFSITATNNFYTDWDMDFASSTSTGGATPQTQVNLNYISAANYIDFNSGTLNAVAMSAVAMDRSGDFYYTETNGASSYLIGVHNAPLYTNVRLKFRFLIPTGTGLVDADGVNYDPLVGYHFVGAPVADDQGDVYAAAVKGNAATVLCFRSNQGVSASAASVLPIGATVPDLTSATISQDTSENTIAPGNANQTFGQFVATTDTISFYNFSKSSQTFVVLGNLTEPQPVLATDTTVQDATPVTLALRTNLVWYVTPFATAGSVTGLSRVGSSLFLCDGTNLYRLSTAPAIGTGKVVSTLPSTTPLGNSTAPGPGAVGAVPSVGGSVMIVNGQNGVEALTRQETVIADNDRVLGVDGDGGAIWSVDATTRTDLTVTPPVSTKVALNHPTALSQYAFNDYLIADTGNNRCVRFDSGGNVQWELTRFQDPSGLMGAGQPLTLSQPTSVVTRPVNIPATAASYPGGTITYYLVADSGNDRIVEVADTMDANGNLVSNHVLTWVSHTGDQNGRQYRYGCAAYYTNTAIPSGISIAATVTNVRVGPLAAAGGPGAISGDAPGGSLVVFNYPASIKAFSASAPSDLVYTTAAFYAQAQPSGAYTPYAIRNPRFLQLYTPPTTATSPIPAAVSPFEFLYADDNGAFDLSYDGTKKAFIAGPDRLQFKVADYNVMGNSAVGVAGTLARTNFPFVPTCVQGLGTDSQPSGANTITTRRYLITQNYSQGELGTTTTPGKLGGEIFEVDVSASAATTSPGTITATTVLPVGGFAGNQTLSHPALTGPLTQPTFGVRLP